MRRRNHNPTPNAGSMADIGFLLLIFFLVSTTMIQDKGIKVVLPEFYSGPPGRAIERNVLDVKLNSSNELLVEDELHSVDDLKQTVIRFITNPDREYDKPLSPRKAIISLQHGSDTSYDAYIATYDQLKSAVMEIRDIHARGTFGKPYKDLESDTRIKINEQFPFVISESEFQL